MNYTIRPIEPRDARGLNEIRRMPGVFENILGHPAEPLKRSEEHIANLGPNDFQFVAVTGTETGEELVIGSAGLSLSASPRMRHVGNVGIMVHRDYQNIGVGRALMNALLDLADNWFKLVRVELTVYEDNERAIHLYESLGFEREGLRRKTAVRNGEYVNEWMMGRIRE